MCVKGGTIISLNMHILSRDKEKHKESSISAQLYYYLLRGSLLLGLVSAGACSGVKDGGHEAVDCGILEKESEQCWEDERAGHRVVEQAQSGQPGTQVGQQAERQHGAREEDGGAGLAEVNQSRNKEIGRRKRLW